MTVDSYGRPVMYSECLARRGHLGAVWVANYDNA